MLLTLAIDKVPEQFTCCDGMSMHDKRRHSELDSKCLHNEDGAVCVKRVKAILVANWGEWEGARRSWGK